MAKINIGYFMCMLSGHKWYYVYEFNRPPRRVCKVCSKKQAQKPNHNSYIHYSTDELWIDE